MHDRSILYRIKMINKHDGGLKNNTFDDLLSAVLDTVTSCLTVCSGLQVQLESPKVEDPGMRAEQNPSGGQLACQLLLLLLLLCCCLLFWGS